MPRLGYRTDRKTPLRKQPSLLVIPRVVGEPSIFEPYYTRSTIQLHAKRLRKNPTPAEFQLNKILNGLGGGVLRNRFVAQHVISGKWIVDFFFFEIRLAIEVDGSIHRTAEQMKKDICKERDCARFDITLLRLTNSEVFGHHDHLVAKLRTGWRRALQRENQTIGQQVESAKGVQRPGHPLPSSPTKFYKRWQ